MAPTPPGRPPGGGPAAHYARRAVPWSPGGRLGGRSLPSGRVPGQLPMYPYLSGEAAEYLAAVPVKAFATDALSVDSPPRDDRPRGGPVVHSAFLPRNIPAIEQLVNVESVFNEERAVFVGFPLRVQGGNGSPIRAAALIY